MTQPQFINHESQLLYFQLQSQDLLFYIHF